MNTSFQVACRNSVDFLVAFLVKAVYCMLYYCFCKIVFVLPVLLPFYGEWQIFMSVSGKCACQVRRDVRGMVKCRSSGVERPVLRICRH